MTPRQCMIVLAGGALAFAVPVTAAEPAAPAAVAEHPRCSGQDITVDGAFEQAGFAACRVTPSGTVVMTIRPETTPINPSPWYAARLTGSAGRTRQIELDYGKARHRYRPWISVNGSAWQQLTVRADASEQGFTIIDLPAFTGQLYLAAQPLRPLAGVMTAWQARLATGQVVVEAEAQSREGRSVPLFRHGPADATHLHFLAARQHPPETTGAAAFDAFADALLAQKPAERCPGHAFLFAPILNPDGIARGHWRTNAGYIDLNRDWGQFREPETAGIGRALTAAAATARLVSVLDFHSTRRDVLYTSEASGGAGLPFMRAVGATTGLDVTPNRITDPAILKNWAELRFGAASFTVELADSNSPESAARVGAQIARLFMDHLACPAAGA